VSLWRSKKEVREKTGTSGFQIKATLTSGCGTCFARLAALGRPIARGRGGDFHFDLRRRLGQVLDPRFRYGLKAVPAG